MARWKDIEVPADEIVGVTAEDEEPVEEEYYGRSLAGKLWTDNAYNVRAFKQMIVDFWRLKNPVETQELGKNLYLFRFSTKRDLENVLKNGPWSFDSNILVLKRITGFEQPSEMEMKSISFWARIYDLPLKPHSESMAIKLGDVLGKFEEADAKDSHRMGRFLRTKVQIDLTKPLKRGTIVRYNGKDLKVFFKYERLPTFCFVCGRIGHQLRDCDEAECLDGEGFEEIEEKEIPFGPWLRASPLPRSTFEPRRDSGSSSCTKSLFTGTSTSKAESVGDHVEDAKVDKPVEEIEEEVNIVKEGQVTTCTTNKEIEKVAETFESIDLTPKCNKTVTKDKTKSVPRAKWSRVKGRKAKTKKELHNDTLVVGKRQLIEVMISEGTPDDLRIGWNKKFKDNMEVDEPLPEGVLDDQHHPTQ
ncbi:zinc CCHC-type-like protein [Trifolium medium]|uniref:Zinc CCHC-type-like protein n=1 Tax=Trifolium medium TaxID=97028 RepID=A0A392MFB2_9FABA|nr:zinc CCHC-type-like protein [Trifolium medium]